MGLIDSHFVYDDLTIDAIPSFNIEELLSRVSRSSSEFNSVEKEILHEGLFFLQKAREGSQLVETFYESGKVKIDFERIESCYIAQRAFEKLFQSSNTQFNEFLEKSIETITTLIEFDHNKCLDLNFLKILGKFFLHVTK
jgi:hypothetical protein